MKKLKLKKGTSLYHGTRYQNDQKQWWGIGKFPNKEGEDGGVSFTLDADATPKVKNANVILEYTLTRNVDAIECKSKGEFYQILKNDATSVCYTRHEQEVVIALAHLDHYLEFSEWWYGWGSM